MSPLSDLNEASVGLNGNEWLAEILDKESFRVCFECVAMIIVALC